MTEYEFLEYRFLEALMKFVKGDYSLAEFLNIVSLDVDYCDGDLSEQEHEWVNDLLNICRYYNDDDPEGKEWPFMTRKEVVKKLIPLIHSFDDKLREFEYLSSIWVNDKDLSEYKAYQHENIVDVFLHNKHLVTFKILPDDLELVFVKDGLSWRVLNTLIVKYKFHKLPVLSYDDL